MSRVKYIILQHLPVFLQKTSKCLHFNLVFNFYSKLQIHSIIHNGYKYLVAGETDSQLVNSVYLDNTAMELYQGRLEKSPGAIALRMRW